MFLKAIHAAWLGLYQLCQQESVYTWMVIGFITLISLCLPEEPTLFKFTSSSIMAFTAKYTP